MHTNAVLGYAAGILDGEGTISIRRTRPREGYSAPTYGVFISVQAVDPAIPRWLQDHFGGAVSPIRCERCSSGVSWVWTLSRNAAVPLLKEARQFMVLKADQAWLALEYDQQCPPHGGTRRSSGYVALQEGFYLAMKQLHGRLR